MIILNALEKQFGPKVLYNKITASLNPSYRIALIGPNGAGKTMLMRILMGTEHLDSGKVEMPANLRIGYLPQEIETIQNTTALNQVLCSYTHLFSIEEKAGQLARTHGNADYQKAADEFDRFHTEATLKDAYSLPARAKSILAGLGVPSEFWEQQLSDLPGGFRMRVFLARLLLESPDFLLLDEPTNHLDMDSLIWLEKFLERFPGGVLVISHDRDFLRRVTTHTAELIGGTLTLYTGKVDDYVLFREQKELTDERRIKNIQQKIDQTQEFIDRFKAKNTKASQAHSKEKQLDRLLTELPGAARLTAPRLRFKIPEASRCGTTPIIIENAVVAYGDKQVFTRLSFTVNRGDRIALIGPNGAGKSTLLKVCAEQLKLIAGEVRIGHNSEIRYYSQFRIDQLDLDQTVFTTIARAANTLDRKAVQSLLGSFLFSDTDVDKKVRVLSGGEKSRLSLAVILANPGNVLLLDEPTNHLDLESVDYLALALAEFTGTMMIVSHDQEFVSRIANRIIEVRPGSIRDFPGTLGDYRIYIEAGYGPNGDDGGPIKNQSSKVSDEKEKRIERREEIKKISRKIEKIEAAIAGVEGEIVYHQKILENPANASNYVLLAECNASISQLHKQNDGLLEEWETFHSQLELIKGEP